MDAKYGNIYPMKGQLEAKLFWMDMWTSKTDVREI